MQFEHFFLFFLSERTKQHSLMARSRSAPTARGGASAPGVVLGARTGAAAVAAAALLAVIGITASGTRHAEVPDSLLAAAPVAAQRLAATSAVTSAVKAIHQRLAEDKLAAAALTRLATDEAMLVSALTVAKPVMCKLGPGWPELAELALARVCSVPERKAIDPAQGY
jgi:hypothetical protein